MNKTILFFDADCLFCNFWVQFLLKQDQKKQIYFAALQSKVAQIYLEQKVYQDLKSLYVLHENKIYQKSEAVFQIISILKGKFYILFFLKIFPNFILDFFYDLIAKHRYKILKDQCLILKDERILD